MKTLITFILLLTAFGTFAQDSYIRVADRPDYERYLQRCKDSVYIEIWQVGKVTLKSYSQNGINPEQLKMMVGEYPQDLVGDTTWYEVWKPGRKATSYTIYSNEKPVYRKRKVKVPIRYPSKIDFNTLRLNGELYWFIEPNWNLNLEWSK